MQPTGTLYGVGVGPGDPELLTLKAVRILQSVPVVAYPAVPGGGSQARDIAAAWLTGQREVPIAVSCQADRGPALRAYDAAAVILAEALAAGQDAAVLCEGDPLFYGSFSYLLERLADRFPCIVIPGITSVSAVAAVSVRPLVSGDEAVCILPATADPATLRRALSEYPNVAILKPGRLRPRILDLLRDTGRLADAVYVEQATRTAQRIVTTVAELPATPGPYFALFLITRKSAGE
jgi:precorrin-2/cobalt-factor-2 C20-methyltransferase